MTASSSGWKFSVTIPSWTHTTLERDQPVVLYKVEVRIIPPQSSGQPRVRSVNRRYNHFHKLHAKLVEELGQSLLAGREVPSKHSLFNVNRRPELIERRRKELQQWLWRLISDPVIAKTQALDEFLELRDISRLNQRAFTPQAASEVPESVVDGSYNVSEGSSPREDSRSEASGFTSASMMTDRMSMRGSLPTANFGHDRGTGRSRVGLGRQLSASGSALGASVSGILDEGNGVRLGLRIEHRGNLKRLVKSLKERLDAASLDLQDAIEAMHTEKDAKRQLSEKVVQLEARMSVDHTQREVELERLLSQERQSVADLRTALQEAAGKQEQLKEELEALQEREAAAASVLEKTSRSAEEMTAVEDMWREEVAKLSEENTLALRRAESAEAKSFSTAEQAESVRKELRKAVEASDAAKAKSKADMKLLAKEVKNLRSQLATALQRADVAEKEAKDALEQVTSSQEDFQARQAAHEKAVTAVEQTAESKAAAKLQQVEREADRRVQEAESRAEKLETEVAALRLDCTSFEKEQAAARAQAYDEVARAVKQAKEEAAAEFQRTWEEISAQCTGMGAKASRAQLELEEMSTKAAELQASHRTEVEAISQRAAAELEKVQAVAAADVKRARAQAAAEVRQAKEEASERVEEVVGRLSEAEKMLAEGMDRFAAAEEQRRREKAAAEEAGVAAAELARSEAERTLERAAAEAERQVRAAEARAVKAENKLSFLAQSQPSTPAKATGSQTESDRQGVQDGIDRVGDTVAQSVVLDVSGDILTEEGPGRWRVESQNLHRSISCPSAGESLSDNSESHRVVLSDGIEGDVGGEMIAVVETVRPDSPSNSGEGNAPNGEEGGSDVTASTSRVATQGSSDLGRTGAEDTISSHDQEGMMQNDVAASELQFRTTPKEEAAVAPVAAADPFAPSGALDLFSGLDVAAAHHSSQIPDSLDMVSSEAPNIASSAPVPQRASKGQSSVPFDSTVNSLELAPRHSGFDALDLFGGIRQEEGSSNAQSSPRFDMRPSSDILSWDSAQGNLLASPQLLSPDLNYQSALTSSLSEAAANVLPVASTGSSQDLSGAMTAPDTVPSGRQHKGLEGPSGSPSQPLEHVSCETAHISHPGDRGQASEVLMQAEKASANVPQPPGIFVRLITGPGSGSQGGASQQNTPTPSPSRTMGSFMTKIGFGGQSGTSPAEAHSSATSAGQQGGLLSGRDRLESFARGLMRKSGN